jgi:hypothetical protein
MAIALKRGSNGDLQAFQAGDSIQVDSLERHSGSGNIVIGSGLGADEIQLGSAASEVAVLGDLSVDGQLNAALDAGGFAITNVGTSLEVAGGGEIRLWDVDNSNYVGFEAPALTGNQIWILPATDSTGTQYLTSDGAGNLSWSTPAGTGDVVWIGGAAVDNTIARYHLTTGQVIQGSGVTVDDSNNVLADADTSTEGAPRTFGFVNLSSTEATRFDFDQGGGEGLGHVFGGGITVYSEHAIVLRGDRALGTPPATWDTETGIGVLVPNTTAGSEALVVRGATSQTAALQQWRNVGDTVLLEVTAAGDLDMSENTVIAQRRTIISPTAIAAQANNYDPTDFGTAEIVRITLTGSQTITGFAAPVAGENEHRIIINVDTVDVLTIAHESTSSTAANRVAGPNGEDVALGPGEICEILYDATSTRWRVTYQSGQTHHAVAAWFEQEFSNGNSGSSATIDFSSGQKQSITLNAATPALTISTPGVGNYLLRVIQDTTGGRLPTWTRSGGGAELAPGGALVLSTGANDVDLISVYDNGTDVHLTIVKDFVQIT